MRKRVFAVLLALCVALGLAPVFPAITALAASYTVGNAAELDDALADIDAHVGLSHNITLSADISYYDKIWINRGTQLVLHLAGHQLNAYGAVQVDQLSRITLDDAEAGSAFNALGGVMVNSTGVATVTNAADPASAYAIPAGAYEGGTLTVKGNVIAARDTAIQSYDSGSTVTVYGNVVFTDEGYCIRASGGAVTVNGNVQSSDAGVMADSGGHITICGNVTTNDYGVYAEDGGTITVDGVITAPYPVSIHDSHTAPAEQAISGGYAVYTSSAADTSIIRVKLPVITAPTVTAGTYSSLTATGITVAGGVTNIGGEAPSAYGIVYATGASPTTANGVVAGSGAAAGFTAALTGLTPNTIYYARAFATNSAGTGYGNNVSFMTLSDGVPLIPAVTTGNRVIGSRRGPACESAICLWKRHQAGHRRGDRAGHPVLHGGYGP